jgi:hypothetical protein
MKNPSRRASTRRAFMTAVLGAVALSGCGGTSAPESADQDQARKVLDQALAAWQKGETVEGMKAATPSILVSDPSWSRGDALKKFEVTGDGRPAGAERVFAVTLWLTDAAGKESKESVDYKVGTDPILTVFRALF